MPARAAAMLTLVGAINMPIIKFSVDWWNTLHQPASVFRMGGPTLDKRASLIPLLVMALAFIAAVRHAACWRRCATRSCAGASAALQMMQAGQPRAAARPRAEQP